MRPFLLTALSILSKFTSSFPISAFSELLSHNGTALSFLAELVVEVGGGLNYVPELCLRSFRVGMPNGEKNLSVQVTLESDPHTTHAFDKSCTRSCTVFAVWFEASRVVKGVTSGN